MSEGWYARSDRVFQKRDAKLRAGLFTEDGVFVNAFGVQREGRAAIERFWKELFATGTFNQAEVIPPAPSWERIS